MMAHHLKEYYQEDIVPALMQSLDLDNVMEVPRIQKAVVNIGVGEALDNAKALDYGEGVEHFVAYRWIEPFRLFEAFDKRTDGRDRWLQRCRRHRRSSG